MNNHSILYRIKKRLGVTSDIKEYKKLGIVIGEGTTIQSSALDKTHPHLIQIGKNCTLTHCTLLTHDATTKRSLGKSKIGCITIGDNCFVGLGAIILPNVRIGNNCIIGAGAVVGKDVPNDSVVVGNPCKIIGSTKDYIKNINKK